VVEGAKYRIDPEGITITPTTRVLQRAGEEHGIKLDAGQAAWYVVMLRAQKADMKREYPSTIDEAFEGANEERYFAAADAPRQGREGRIKVIPYPPHHGGQPLLRHRARHDLLLGAPVRAPSIGSIDYYEVAGQTYDAVAREAQQRQWLVKQIYLPHDGNDESVVTTVTPKQLMEKLFPGVRVRVVPRSLDKQTSINEARSKLWESYFHEVNCAVGLDHLDNYRKKWSEAVGNWSDEPRHDIHSHGADAYQTFALGWEPGHEQAFTPASFPGLIQRHYAN
jgi:hypothetical protein